MTAPSPHLQESLALTSDALIDLFEMQLRNVETPTSLLFRDGMPGLTTTYGGKTYDHLPTKMSGLSRSSGEEKSRPTLTVVNPAGIWNRHARDGRFERATLARYRVLKQHLDANVLLYETNVWFVARVPQVVTNQGITFELRGLADGSDQLLPVRKYMPDDGFPFVTLR